MQGKGSITDTKDEISSISQNLNEIKQLKELLDMEAITQEEFDFKKKELLNL
ncbi:SHOCT domain-containing protein [Staphylococcus saprophyticus]|uniref:SHOCT domain-containing protein n=1 Tax=Staphylococcus saprophyticus TaxID=29385 RepID=UPI001C71F514|nr:SHOCT domain-containing protein [Staphylococcus saprophyticus]